MKNKDFRKTKGFLAFQKKKKKLTLDEAMKYEYLALQLATIEDDKILFVYKYGRANFFCEIKPRRRKLRFLVPSTIMDAYLEKFESGLTAGLETSGFPYLEVRELNVNGTPLTGYDLRQAQVRERFGVTVVSVRRKSGEVLVNPHADTIIREGDTLRVFGLPHQIDHLADQLIAPERNHK